MASSSSFSTASASNGAHIFPEKADIDLHTVATIYLYERMLREIRFRHTRLIEIHGNEPVPAGVEPLDWDL